ncbi:hypothetical protein SESBI_10058 [Sesbania bispinosa]|nr:hypothetical protein SESBI_10058 [Sesbania bispinosa]
MRLLSLFLSSSLRVLVRRILSSLRVHLPAVDVRAVQVLPVARVLVMVRSAGLLLFLFWVAFYSGLLACFYSCSAHLYQCSLCSIFLF